MKELISVAAANLLCASAIIAAPPAEASPAMRFRIATFNINWGNVDLEQITDTLRDCDADLVCLQETNSVSRRHITRGLRSEYRFMRFQAGDKPAGGFAYLSKAPIEQFNYFPPGEGKFGVCIARVKLAGRELQVVNIHLTPLSNDPPSGVRDAARRFGELDRVHRKELEFVHRQIAPDTASIIVGDFNSPVFLSAPQRLIDRGFTDSFAAVNPDPEQHITWQWNLNGRVWKARIDHILHGSSCRTIESSITPNDASDHFLLVSTLEWVEEKGKQAELGQAASRPGG
jgi:endonuclease/exonuclease/phosphatase family metal-dependent hydrolase